MNNPRYNILSAEEKFIIEHKGTEPPFSGKYDNFFEIGIYVCRRCDADLYQSVDKFEANCGWPAFDKEVAGSIIRLPDLDGQRTEIACANCKGHLGHEFIGEGFTKANSRHCVNSLSMKFVGSGQNQS